MTAQFYSLLDVSKTIMEINQPFSRNWFIPDLIPKDFGFHKGLTAINPVRSEKHSLYPNIWFVPRLKPG